MKEKFHCEITERKGDQKMVKTKDTYAGLYGKFENEKKRTKKFLTFQSGNSNPRFSVIFVSLRVTRSNLSNLLKQIGL